ncbi:helix-turn-helix domain-containing protein [Bradyrhizobium sp. U87765 SZCCT0131]|nr:MULTISPECIES: helix-turn-helix domain-containing protein [unclassified Bradyrhizobium]MBR1216521.1 helix-turn-helix domain-containing protein [Bradyrhizobium sp. U87765 SZCCT0131]MBR1259723.1 helix-turn-helix domain-containing protein [Bradyrhizobium sp. U87765 SZCCT0134]MBR1305864.1 helix-turn-helix domain-containing protein [Bradyrhizobium sp. U87765 SZCCT0110]MBR1322231.1 helix-turn-helix domain-containing protein [Bradyrhizobium sp. U87765 SZCCT0109]MBR1350490.1 helix-turn-helix domain-
MPTHTRAPGGAPDTAPLPADPILADYRRAAALLGITPGALRDLCYRGRGPVQIKIGRRTLFAVADLHAFVAAHRSPLLQRPTAEQPRRKRGRPSIAEMMAQPLRGDE